MEHKLANLINRATLILPWREIALVAGALLEDSLPEPRNDLIRVSIASSGCIQKRIHTVAPVDGLPLEVCPIHTEHVQLIPLINWLEHIVMLPKEE